MTNKVILLGNVGKEPEIRTMNNGNKVAVFNLATSEVWKDKQNGQKKENTEWHRIAVYSQGLVDIVSKYIHKGSKIYIEGTLRTKKWKDNKNIDRIITEVVLQGFNCTLEMLNNKNSNNSSVNTPLFNQEEEKENYDDEIPY